MTSTDFELAVLDHRWPDSVEAHRRDLAIPYLEALDARRRIATITLDDIDAYAWDRQTIVLTEAATTSLTEVLHALPAASEAHDALMAMRQNLGWGNAIERHLYLRCFSVSVGGHDAYRGLFLDATSQRAINFPVARIVLDGTRARVSLLPVHVPFAIEDPIDEAGTRRDLALPAEARDDLQPLGQPEAFIGLFAHGIATSAAAVEHRPRIRDPRIRELMAAAGKLVSGWRPPD